MSFVVISCSLNPDSNSRRLASVVFKNLEGLDVDVEFVDMRDFKLPLCDGDASYEDDAVVRITKKLEKARGYIIAIPVYNFDANAVAKNLVELTGSKVWEDKVVGFVCAAGGRSSYMSIMGLANSLMLDFRCFVIPKFVYATDDAFRGDEVSDSKVKERLKELSEDIVRVTNALK